MHMRDMGLTKMTFLALITRRLSESNSGRARQLPSLPTLPNPLLLQLCKHSPDAVPFFMTVETSMEIRGIGGKSMNGGISLP